MHKLMENVRKLLINQSINLTRFNIGHVIHACKMNVSNNIEAENRKSLLRDEFYNSLDYLYFLGRMHSK